MNLIHTFLALREVFKKYKFISPNLAKLIMQILYNQKTDMLEDKNIETSAINIYYTLQEYMLYRPKRFRKKDIGFIYNIYNCCKYDRGFRVITENYNLSKKDVKLIYYCILSDKDKIIEYYCNYYYKSTEIFIRYYDFKDIEFAKKILHNSIFNCSTIYMFNPNIAKHKEIIEIINSKLNRDITKDLSYTHPLTYVRCRMPLFEVFNYFIKKNTDFNRECLLDFGYIYEYYFLLSKK